MRITDNGLDREIYNDVRNAVATDWVTAFPEAVTIEKSVNGRIISEIAFNNDKTNALIQIVETTFHPNQAVGKQLSNLAIIMGEERRKSTRSTVMINVYTNDHPANIPETFTVSDGENEYRINAAITIDRNSVVLLPFTAINYGKIKAPAKAITRIITAVFGVDRVENPNAVNVGLDADSDSVLRQRLLITSAFKSGTIEGIAVAVRDVEGVEYSAIAENKSNVINEIGMPPHSVFIVADGGEDSEIATALLRSVSAGIDYTEKTDIPAADIREVLAFSNITQSYYRVHFARSTPFELDIVLDYTIVETMPPDAMVRQSVAIRGFVDRFRRPTLTASQLICAINQANTQVIDVDNVTINSKDKVTAQIFARFKVRSIVINGYDQPESRRL